MFGRWQARPAAFDGPGRGKRKNFRRPAIEPLESRALLAVVATMVDDALPGGGINSLPAGSVPSYLTNVSGTLYFVANDGANGEELWRINPAGLAEVVEDAIPGGGIRPETLGINSVSGSFPKELTNVNGTLYFRANDGTNGFELWRINPAGVAEMVEDAIPGGGIRPGSRDSSPNQLTNFNGTLYFVADDGTNGSEVWRINPAGVAEMVEDAIPGGGIRPGSLSSNARSLTSVSGTLYFQANDGANGDEIWRISPAGVAEMIEDAIPGGGIRPNAGSYLPYSFILVNVSGTLYFRASDGVNGEELWRINSAGRAEMVEDAIPGGGIAPGPDGSRPFYLTNANGTLYFRANDGTNGEELWRISPAGNAEMIEDAIPGGGIGVASINSSPSYLTSINGTLYFRANDGTNGVELWRVAPAGMAEMVEDAIPGEGIRPRAGDSYPLVGSYPSHIVNVNGTLYFSADDGTNGRELWWINPSGVAELIEDTIPGGGIRPGSGNSSPSHLTNIDGTLYFRANDGTNGEELFRINPAGVPEMIEDAIPGGGIWAGMSKPVPYTPGFGLFLTNVNGTLFFQADDGANGRELWRINSAGTAEMVEDVIPGGGIRPGSYPSSPGRLTNVGGALYFQADDGVSGQEPWRIDAAGQAEMVEDAILRDGIRPDTNNPYTPRGSYPTELTNATGTLYFRANDGTNGEELWRIDPTGRAVIVEDAIPGGGIRPASSSSPLRYLTNVNGTLYFRANDGTSGEELWRTNPSGVAEVVEDAIPGGGIRTSGDGSYPKYLTNVNGTLYFRALADASGIELWRVNPAGVAELVEDAIPGGGIRPGLSFSYPSSLTNINGTLYFRANDGTNGYELWRINPAGVAEMVEDAVSGGGIRPGSNSSISFAGVALTNVNGTLYFQANDGTNGYELWRINPTGRAEMVEDVIIGGGIRPGSFASYPRYLTNVNGTLFFRANDGTNGYELWRINPAGRAEMVEDAFPGGGIRPGSSNSITYFNSYLTNVNGTLYFLANDGTNGYELWRASPAGVAEMVDDAIPGGGIRPGSISASITNLTSAGGTLYFIAGDGTNGIELWRINPLGRAELIEDAIPGGGIWPGAGDSIDRSQDVSFSETNGTLYFTASNGIDGKELWRIAEVGASEPFFPRTLEVMPSGVEIAFQWGDVDAARLNLYAGQGQGDTAPDVTLVGRTTGPVACSVVWDSATRRLRIVRTGGPLPPDDYTLRLKSGAGGIVSTTGKQLDGVRDGTSDDDYIATFTVAPTTGRTISLPDFSRGPGQVVRLADPQRTATDGIPLSIDNADGVQSVRFDLNYDPRLLSIDRANSHVGPGMTGWTLSLVEDVPGKLVGRLSGPTPLAAGARTLLVLKAQVPTNAPRNAAQALRLTTLQLNANGVARGDDAIQTVAPFGDASGDGVYSGLDASLLARISVGLDSGFSAMPTIDPAIIGDVTGNGTISGLDAAFVARKAIGLNQPEIPDLPTGPPIAALPVAAPLVLFDAANVPSSSAATATSVEPLPSALSALGRRKGESRSAEWTLARDAVFATFELEPVSRVSGDWMTGQCARELASDRSELDSTEWFEDGEIRW